jgi:hypothetical protein
LFRRPFTQHAKVTVAMSGTLHFGAIDSVSDRRTHFRERVLFSCAQLGEENGGIVLNISEGGMALQVVTELSDQDLPPLRFQFSHSHTWVEATGRIAWLSDSKKTVGVEFTNLPEEARRQIKAWISSLNAAGEFVQSNTATSKPVFTARALRYLFTAAQSSQEAQDASTPGALVDTAGVASRNVPGGFPKAGHLAALVVAILWVAAFLFLGHHMRELRNKGKGSDTVLPAAGPAVPAGNPAGNSGARAPMQQSSPSAGPRYVLQVGAMAHRQNADALAKSLRQNNFAVFVTAPGPAGRLYLVLVGPYDQPDRADSVKKQLQQQGLSAVRSRWNPAEHPKPASP